MTDREKVVNGLECCTADLAEYHQDHFCNMCPYKSTDPQITYCFNKPELMRDALSLLKAQEPRVMQFDELEDTIADRAVWYEAFLTEVPTIAIVCEKSIVDDAYTIVDFISGRHRVTRRTYGAAWRCWTSRPTDEQRKAVKWDD